MLHDFIDVHVFLPIHDHNHNPLSAWHDVLDLLRSVLCYLAFITLQIVNGRMFECLVTCDRYPFSETVLVHCPAHQVIIQVGEDGDSTGWDPCWVILHWPVEGTDRTLYLAEGREEEEGLPKMGNGWAMIFTCSSRKRLNLLLCCSKSPRIFLFLRRAVLCVDKHEFMSEFISWLY